MRLGVLDWGVGGLGLVRWLRERRSDLDLLYLSDSGATPYGLMGRRALRARLHTLCRWLAGEGVTHLAIACNAANAALEGPRGLAELPDLEVRAVATEAVRHLIEISKDRSLALGVLGGRLTVRSGLYARPLRAAGRTVRQRVGQSLSALVEAGRLEGPEVETEVERLARPLLGVDRLVLACTHYPALASVFARRLPALALFDPIEALGRAVLRWPLPSGSGRLEVRSSGDEAATIDAARRAFGVTLERVHALGRAPLISP